ncbi:M20 family metallopeptidase [Pseudodesulfovibrio sediminis]|uniref:Peptidase M20 n=1 Tax=Pseudodesulfovibrio sediminis TaxID=2810563 RepID=A0ABN6EX35_9BACT|nr:M20 family metallopeptidase [Pseudodesulfovibrio sediminis]BCS89744.1 peptidase M20 [Pseudodesulfovibrio sediminis]
MIQTIKQFLTENEQAMFDLLEKVININSWTANKPGVDAVANVFLRAVKEMGFTTRIDSQPVSGDHVVAANAARLNTGGGALLIGHMDTVFPPDMGFDTYRKDGGTIYGPGVIDMKSGIVTAIFAARALQAAGLDDIPLGFVFNSDEETGSPNSRVLITEEARKSDFCFVMESSGPGGEIITGRKGRIVFDVTATGQAAHAGHCPVPRPSAIVALAHKITAMEKLNGYDDGTTLNSGVIEGGVGPNTVAAHATARVETRFTSPAHRAHVWAAINDIVNSTEVDGTACNVEIVIERPPMMETEANLGLYSVVEASARELGMDVRPNFRGGGSDANIISEIGIPVLDGLGPFGGKLHTVDEYMFADSMMHSALLTAVSIINGHKKYQ